jgi:hypothetical protein
MVTKTIRVAPHKIRAHHPALSHHLAISITPGTVCTTHAIPNCAWFETTYSIEYDLCMFQCNIIYQLDMMGCWGMC